MTYTYMILFVWQIENCNDFLFVFFGAREL